MPNIAQKHTETWSMHARMKAPLIGYKEGCSTHARWTPKMAKWALDRAYAGPKTHQKWPETWLGNMQIRAPLLGQIC